MKARHKILIGIAMGAGVLGILCAWQIPHARERAHRSRCMAPLGCCIRKASLMYAMDNNGAFPSKIQDMTAYANNPMLFICPGSGTVPPASLAQCTNWLDYIYISWPTGEQTPTNYPWIYDRRLSHHRGEGINLAPVSGPAFWDEGAQWLQTFAREHPDLKIPMPEDLPASR